jgi:CubicO group peptidase (beta-lactamase class C family)
MKLFLLAVVFLPCVFGSFLGSIPLAHELDGIISVSRDTGASLYRAVLGHQNLDFNISMPSDARFMIGSNTKLFTTVAIYQLHEQGKLNVTADISSMLDTSDFAKFGLPNQSKFCPTMPESATCQVITLVQLLSMSSGLYPSLNCNAAPVNNFECNQDIFIVNPGSIGRVVGSFINNPLVFVPGTQYMYSNPNFVLAAYFVEKFSGLKFGAYLKKHIFEPAGLANTYYDFFDNQLGQADPKRAYEYLKFYNNDTLEFMGYGPLRRELDTGAVSGTGGIISTPEDEGRFWRMLLNRSTGGAPLLSKPASQQSILAPWTFFGDVSLPNGTFYAYYSQGLLVICAAKGCPGGPSFVNYEGGTFATHTVNLYDYRLGKEGTLAQVWTSTNLYRTTPAELAAAQASEEGPFFPALSIASAWTAGTPNPAQMSWALLFQFYIK